MLNISAKEVLFEGQADEYAQIIASYPICHEDCIEILKVVALIKNNRGCSNEQITNKLSELFL
jgi:hypothetical protein